MNTTRAEASFNDIAESTAWIVFANVNGESRRFRVEAVSEAAACIEIEDRYGVDAISASPAGLQSR